MIMLMFYATKELLSTSANNCNQKRSGESLFLLYLCLVFLTFEDTEKFRILNRYSD